MNPSQLKKATIDVRSEIHRLYLGIKKHKVGTEKIVLMTKNSIDYARKQINCLIRVKGSQSKYMSIDIEKVDDKKKVYRLLYKVNDKL